VKKLRMTLRDCNASVTRVLQRWYRVGASNTAVHSSQHVTLQNYKSVTSVLQAWYKSVTRFLQECYKVVTRVLEECCTLPSSSLSATPKTDCVPTEGACCVKCVVP
jgi:hypothetical protein